MMRLFVGQPRLHWVCQLQFNNVKSGILQMSIILNQTFLIKVKEFCRVRNQMFRMLNLRPLQCDELTWTPYNWEQSSHALAMNLELYFGKQKLWQCQVRILVNAIFYITLNWFDMLLKVSMQQFCLYAMEPFKKIPAFVIAWLFIPVTLFNAYIFPKSQDHSTNKKKYIIHYKHLKLFLEYNKVRKIFNIV